MEKKNEKIKVGDKVHMHNFSGTYTVFQIKGRRAWVGTKYDTELEWQEVDLGAIKCKYGGNKIKTSSSRMESIVEFYKEFL